jgi:RND family efflux transporter MFP subunit
MFRTSPYAGLTAGLPLGKSAPPMKPIRFTASLFAASALFLTGCEDKKQVAAPPPPDVEVVAVTQKDVPITRDWVGTLDGLVNAQIVAQVSGILLKQEYSNGAYVTKGTELFQIDPRPFQAALDQAQGQLQQAQGKLAQAQGQLAEAVAQQGKTQLDVNRYTPLAKESAISQQELDDAVQNNLAAQASVEANKANIEAAKANIDAAKAAVYNAQINLGFTKIVSPVDGIAAIATAQVGNLVSPQAGALTTVSTINPILANINPSEEQYLNVAKSTGATPGVASDPALQKLQFHLTLANGSDYPHPGRIWAVNREVGLTTGTILVQITFPNPGNVLRPGGFGMVSSVVSIRKDAILVPQRAVSDVQGTNLVAVVGADNKVSIVPVKTGSKFGLLWVIDDGLKPGDRVVAEGIQKVKQDMQVNPKPYSPNVEKAKSANS